MNDKFLEAERYVMDKIPENVVNAKEGFNLKFFLDNGINSL